MRDLCNVLSEKNRWARLFEQGRWAPEVRVGNEFQIIYNDYMDLSDIEEAMLEYGSIIK
jgi:hypothetical protein